MSTPATADDQRIHETCRRFSEATGWPLEFVPANQRPPQQHASPDNGSSHGWSIELRDVQPRGTLWMGLPPGAERSREFSTAYRLAELVGDLLNRLLRAESQRDLHARDVVELIDAGSGSRDDADAAQAINRLLKAAADLTQFRSAAFFLLDPSTSQLKLRGLFGAEPGQIPFRRRHLAQSLCDLKALVHGKALIRRAHGGDLWLPGDSTIGLCLVVRSDSGPLGSLWVYDRRDRVPGEYESSLLESISAQIAAKLERIVLLRESASGQRMQRDLRTAGLNQSSATANQPPLPACLDVAAVCTSRYELGGDLCELVPLDDHRVALAVGDASGDSVPAAMIMSAVRGALRTLSDGRPHASGGTTSVVERVNNVLADITPPHQFMSLVYGILDTRDRKLVYTNAGHPAPLLVRGGQCRLLDSHGLLLGVKSRTAYGCSEERLAAGDLLVCFSDGVSEAANDERELFGTRGVIEAVEPVADQAAHVVLENVLERLQKHTAGRNEGDDRTLMVIRVRE